MNVKRAAVAILAAAFILTATPPASAAPGEPVAGAAKKCKKKRKKHCRRAAQDTTLSADAQVLLSRRLWFEYDFDNNGDCRLYQFVLTSGRYLTGGLTRYFVNPVSGQCRLTLPQSQGGEFVWSAQNGVLSITFVGGSGETISLGPYQGGTDERFIQRLGGPLSAWAGCASQFFPTTLRFGCP